MSATSAQQAPPLTPEQQAAALVLHYAVDPSLSCEILRFVSESPSQNALVSRYFRDLADLFSDLYNPYDEENANKDFYTAESDPFPGCTVSIIQTIMDRRPRQLQTLARLLNEMAEFQDDLGYAWSGASAGLIDWCTERINTLRREACDRAFPAGHRTDTDAMDAPHAQPHAPRAMGNSDVNAVFEAQRQGN